jgi:phosphoribosylanthranilate isomerase
MWVKICGNTNLEDAAHAAEAGADAVGFVFAESKRQVTAAQVAAITPHLPAGVERVGVFYSLDADEIIRTVREAGLTAVQLHGGLDQGLMEKLAQGLRGEARIIQTLHWTVNPAGTESDPAGEAPALQLPRDLARIASIGIADRVLIDSKVGAAGGGTGVAYDWSAASAAFASAPASLKIIVAGGLKPGNVAAAIGELKPWGVDVASGVEKSPGRKDPVLVSAFVKNARG